MRILGLDPGIERTGWGLVDSKGHDFLAVDYGCIVTGKQDSLPERLLVIWGELNKIMAKHSPEVVAVEELFFAKNAKSAIQVGHGRGVCLLAAAAHGIPVEEVTPLQVKSSIVGYGAATKEQIATMVQRILSLSKIPRPDDTCDALAIAVTACIKRSFNARLVREKTK
ncbi:MAG TPA: crossover junction endodeoxyribonuclease RuvC [Firmicutes bacterium]|nr:crossover junction endodeoxyribonuclease RuvC [Candidatus Fermentithermobacillaceae bacterium]